MEIPWVWIDKLEMHLFLINKMRNSKIFVLGALICNWQLLKLKSKYSISKWNTYNCSLPCSSYHCLVVVFMAVWGNIWKFHYATANFSTSHQTSITFPYATEFSVAILIELSQSSVVPYATPHRITLPLSLHMMNILSHINSVLLLFFSIKLSLLRIDNSRQNVICGILLSSLAFACLWTYYVWIEKTFFLSI